MLANYNMRADLQPVAFGPVVAQRSGTSGRDGEGESNDGDIVVNSGEPEGHKSELEVCADASDGCTSLGSGARWLGTVGDGPIRSGDALHMCGELEYAGECLGSFGGGKRRCEGSEKCERPNWVRRTKSEKVVMSNEKEMLKVSQLQELKGEVMGGVKMKVFWNLKIMNWNEEVRET